MDYRKIQLTGDSTYIVSLPKSWVTKNKLGKGDVLSVAERGSEIVLKLKEEKERDVEIKIKTSDLDFLARLLITKYIQGYDTIVFRSKECLDPRTRAHLIKTASYLIGLEPFGETKDSITFRMLMKGGRSVLESVERMHDISMLSLRELLDQMASGSYDGNMLDGIVQRDMEIDKFYFLVLRQLKSMSAIEAIVWAQVAKSIERLSDHVESIASELAKKRRKIDRSDLEVFGRLAVLYGDVMLTLKTGDLSLAEEILIKAEAFREEMKAVKGGLEEKGLKNIMIYSSFSRIGDYISDLAESAINLS